MMHCGTLQEFIRLITAEVRKMSPEEKREFREAWLAQIAEKERTREIRYYEAVEETNGTWVVMRVSDRRFLKSCGIDPDGD
jgi:hypothetical protein